MSILKAIGICNKVYKLLKWYKTFMVLTLIFWFLVNCHSEDCMVTLWCVKWTSCLPRWSFTFTSSRSFPCFSCTHKHSTDEHNIVYSYFSITNKSKTFSYVKWVLSPVRKILWEVKSWPSAGIEFRSSRLSHKCSEHWATTSWQPSAPTVLYKYSDCWFFTFLFYA